TLLGKAMHHREAEARPLADALGREKWLGRSPQRLFIHSLTRVDHAEADILAGFQSRTLTLGDAFYPGGQNNVAAVRHRIAGVQTEIEECQLQLIGIHLDRLERERETGLYAERRTYRPLQKLCHSAHEFGNPDHFLLEFVIARKGEHAFSQGRAALRALGCVFKQRYAFGIFGQALAEKFEAAKNRRQQVVEIVRDAAGELPDRLQLLGLEREFTRPLQLLLSFLPVRDFARYFGIPDNVVAVVANGVDDDMGPKAGSVLADTPAFFFKPSFFFDGLKCLSRTLRCAVFVCIE